MKQQFWHLLSQDVTDKSPQVADMKRQPSDMECGLEHTECTVSDS
jgi:hypothetical protein